MSLTDFVWETEVSIRDGVPGIAGTAKADDGTIVPIFVMAEFLEELERRRLAEEAC